MPWVEHFGSGLQEASSLANCRSEDSAWRRSVYAQPLCGPACYDVHTQALPLLRFLHWLADIRLHRPHFIEKKGSKLEIEGKKSPETRASRWSISWQVIGSRNMFFLNSASEQPWSSCSNVTLTRTIGLSFAITVIIFQGWKIHLIKCLDTAYVFVYQSTGTLYFIQFNTFTIAD